MSLDDSEAGLRHPFTAAFSDCGLDDSVRFSSSPSLPSSCASDLLEQEDARPIEAVPQLQLTTETINTEACGPLVPLSGTAIINDSSLRPDDESENHLRSLKRKQDQAAPNTNEEAPKRMRFDDNVYDVPVSPEANYNPKTFSTVTTAVNTAPGSPETLVTA